MHHQTVRETLCGVVLIVFLSHYTIDYEKKQIIFAVFNQLSCRFVNDVLHIRESEKHLFRRAPVERTHREIVVFTLVNG